MKAWRIAKAKRATDLSGYGAALEGGRWNHKDVPALYLGLSPSVCCLETFVHASGPPVMPLKIIYLELPDDAPYYTPDILPEGWQSLPADRASMDFGTEWLNSLHHLGMIVPSAVMPLDQNIVINPRHSAWSKIRIIDIQEFLYDKRMFRVRGDSV